MEAFGNQLVQAHIALRERIEALRDGLSAGVGVADLRVHCLSFCAALERHHTAEDEGAFPVLAREHPELRPVLDELGRDHRIVSDALRSLAALGDVEPVVLRRELDSVAALVETHFTYEERKIAGLLSALTGRVGEADAELLKRATAVPEP
ncbi:hemerythrin domain-containing protein [Saccharothrix sp. HUAS TT1]|uniref:hemerythrin domain-containing protein n=1 Tax=unclassified Saccharothrix TaxID=2593673 RepID=UPI00345BCCE1